MANAFVEIWWMLRHGSRWREARWTKSHPRLGEMNYFGTRSRPGGPVSGYYRIKWPGLDRAIGVDFPSMGNEPTADGVARLEELLADPDALFERSAAQMREAYERTVEEPMPQEWRKAMQIEHITLPDPEEPALEWQVAYWCEAAQHWFVVDFVGEAVTDVRMEG